MSFSCNYKNTDGNGLGDDYEECKNHALAGAEIFFSMEGGGPWDNFVCQQRSEAYFW